MVISDSMQISSPDVSHLRHRFWPLASIFMTFGSLALLVSLIPKFQLIIFVGSLALFALGPILSYLFLRQIELLSPVIVEPDGIRTYDGFGFKAYVRWDQIKSTQNMVVWPGLKWILLNDGRGLLRTACIPLFVEDKDSFFREVAESAGENHVVVKVLRENGFGTS